MYAYKDLLELAGLTGRVYALLAGLHGVEALSNDNVYAIAEIGAAATEKGESGEETGMGMEHVDIVIPTSTAAPLEREQGELEKLKDTETHPPLVKDLSFRITPGSHLMITGSNGLGKTSVARVLAGLWAPGGAAPVLERPPAYELDSEAGGRRRSVLVIPQRAYLPPSSLLEILIYPHSYPQFVASGRTLGEMQQILEDVYLGYLVEREGGWGRRREWRDVLSGGEKQRIGMGRVFYHRPRYAILDGK